jgi:hypothetical protein
MRSRNGGRKSMLDPDFAWRKVPSDTKCLLSETSPLIADSSLPKGGSAHLTDGKLYKKQCTFAEWHKDQEGRSTTHYRCA